MEKNKTPEEMQAHLEACSKKVREQILAGYKTLVDNISESHFKRIHDLLDKHPQDKKINFDRSMATIKAQLYNRIERKFCKNWDECELDKPLAHLEYSKLMFKDGEKKWRPTTVDVEEQTRPLVAKELQRKRNILQRQIAFQDKAIEKLIPQVEQFRRRFAEQIERRQQLMNAIAKEEEELSQDKTKEIHRFLN